MLCCNRNREVKRFFLVWLAKIPPRIVSNKNQTSKWNGKHVKASLSKQSWRVLKTIFQELNIKTASSYVIKMKIVWKYSALLFSIKLQCVPALISLAQQRTENNFLNIFFFSSQCQYFKDGCQLEWTKLCILSLSFFQNWKVLCAVFGIMFPSH